VSGLANKKRESVFTRHPDGAKIAEMVYNKEMTQKRAAEILGCSIPNISLYMKKHFPKHTPDKSKRLKKKPPSPGPESDEPVLVIKLASDATNLEWGSSAWKLMLQNLTQSLMDPHLIVEDQVKLMNALIKLLQFQFKEKDLIPEYKAQEIKLNESQANDIVEKILNDHDEWCPYRREAVKANADKQSKVRFLSPESSSVGGRESRD